MGIMTEDQYHYQMTVKQFGSAAEPSFESQCQQNGVWGREWGCSSDVGILRTVLVHRPGDEFQVIDPTKRLDHLGAWGDPEKGWYWRGEKLPVLEELQAEHDGLVKALTAEGVEIVNLRYVAKNRMKSCYTRDVVISVKGGAIICRMGPAIRRGEELPATQTLAGLGIPILRTIHGSGLVEGGNFAWINDSLALLALSTRTNEEGARQVEEVLSAQGVELLKVHLTGYQIHIDGLFVMVDANVALVNPSGLPFWFLEKLEQVGIRTVEVHPEDPRPVVNCLAVRPGRIIIDDRISPRTADALDATGIEIVPVPYAGMYGNGGSIHCSTSPLIRDSV